MELNRTRTISGAAVQRFLAAEVLSRLNATRPRVVRPPPAAAPSFRVVTSNVRASLRAGRETTQGQGQGVPLDGSRDAARCGARQHPAAKPPHRRSRLDRQQMDSGESRGEAVARAAKERARVLSGPKAMVGGARPGCPRSPSDGQQRSRRRTPRAAQGPRLRWPRCASFAAKERRASEPHRRNAPPRQSAAARS